MHVISTLTTLATPQTNPSFFTPHPVIDNYYGFTGLTQRTTRVHNLITITIKVRVPKFSLKRNEG